MKSAPPSPESLASLRQALLDHYDRTKRALAWRGETDPYRVLVSEVMLQQTRVETVKEYYGAWLERFPDLETLAAAHEDEVLEAWAGLGYYRRARNLHETAQRVRERPDRSLPTTLAELEKLPGVGTYTAGAIASIAFGASVPAVDGNVRRVLARIFDVADPKSRWLRETAASLVDPERPGDWNQALMELGATLCRPRSPRCEECPVADGCAALGNGTQEERPVPRRRSPVRHVTYALALLHDRGRVLLLRRPREGLLGGMWAFPESEVTESRDAAAAARAAAEAVGAEIEGPAEPLARHEHRFTHLHALYLPFAFPAKPRMKRSGSRRWIDARDPDAVALPVAQRRILEALAERLAE